MGAWGEWEVISRYTYEAERVVVGDLFAGGSTDQQVESLSEPIC